jgi:hypothetical protein
MTMALVLTKTAGAAGLGPLAMFFMVPVLIAFAPQPVRDDKRVKVLVILLVLLAIATPALAVPSTICQYAWWAIECWFA